MAADNLDDNHAAPVGIGNGSVSGRSLQDSRSPAGNYLFRCLYFASRGSMQWFTLSLYTSTRGDTKCTCLWQFSRISIYPLCPVYVLITTCFDIVPDPETDHLDHATCQVLLTICPFASLTGFLCLIMHLRDVRHAVQPETAVRLV